MTTAVLGIDLGGTKCQGIVASLDGRILAERSARVADSGSALAALDLVGEQLMTACGMSTPRFVCVGVPAVVDPSTTLAVRGPNVGWSEVDLGSGLVKLGIPYRVENDVNLAALGEQVAGVAQGVADFVVVSIGTGLGGALVSDGRLVRGAHHAAGEFGVLLKDVTQAATPKVGELGSLEQVLTGPAIEAAALELAARQPAAMAEYGANPAASAILAQAGLGKPWASIVAAPVIEALVSCVIAVAAVVDPELIVLDGSVGRALRPLLPRVAKLTSGHIEQPPRLAVSTLAPTSTIHGAIITALNLVEGEK